MSLENKR